jgi:NCS1 family nucleobase:cation symporter-1
MAPPQDLSFKRKVKFAFSSPANFHEAITLDSSVNRFINEDLIPTPPARRTWNTLSYFSYWWSEAWNITTWSLGSSLVVLGVSFCAAVLVKVYKER